MNVKLTNSNAAITCIAKTISEATIATVIVVIDILKIKLIVKVRV
jgi:hypothetical protein